MPGIIKRLEDIAAGVAPEWTTTNIVVRGTPKFPDKTMRGTVRYANRIGGFLPNLQAENRMKLSSPASAETQEIRLNRIVDGLLPGSLVTIAERELQQVFDVNYDSTSLLLTFAVQQDHAAETSVDLFGEPYRVIGATVVVGQQTQITVRGRYQVLIGDKLWIQSSPELLLSGRDYRCVATQGYQQSLYEWNSVLTIDGIVPAGIENDSIVYLRAYPAYKSLVLNVPLASRVPYPLGPFVLDYQSGQMNDRVDRVETLSCQTFDAIGTPIDAYPVAVTKNTPYTKVSIHQSAFLFWNLFQGKVMYRKDQLVMQCDDRGRFLLWTNLRPAWNATTTWRTRIRYMSGSPTQFMYRFYPSALVYAGIGFGGTAQTVDIQLAGESDAIALIVNGQPYAEIEMDGWNISGQEVSKIQAGLVVETVGHQDWQGGSLQLKPYFRTLADLRTQLDTGTRLDSGTLLL